MEIVVYTMAHYDAVTALMRRTPGVSLRDADSFEATARYLERNPGLSFLAVDEDKIIACAMCGHDGRRGYLQHVIVDPAWRGKGIANALVERCLDGLARLGIDKTHIDVLVGNELGNDYWMRRGWERRDDIYRYSMNRSGNANA